MFLARGTAEEVLSFAPEGELLPMAQLQQVGESGRFNGQALEVEILDFVNGVKRPGSSPLLPVLSLAQSGPAVTGAAYFRDYTLQGEWDLSQTRGYLAAKGELDQGEAVVPDGGGGLVTLSLSASARRFGPGGRRESCRSSPWRYRSGGTSAPCPGAGTGWRTPSTPAWSGPPPLNWRRRSPPPWSRR